MAEALKAARSGTEDIVINKVKMSWWQLCEYLDSMTNYGLLETGKGSAKVVVLRTTCKGLVILESYKEMSELIGSANKNGVNNMKVAQLPDFRQLRSTKR